METRKQLEQRIREKYEVSNLSLIAMGLGCFSVGFSIAMTIFIIIK